jgi:hypothetical protein
MGTETTFLAQVKCLLRNCSTIGLELRANAWTVAARAARAVQTVAQKPLDG